MPHNEHVPTPPWKAATASPPLFPRPGKQQQCKTALCSPFPVFPAVPFLGQTCSASTPAAQTETSPTHQTGAE